MEPGIYYDISFEQYLAIDAISNTRLGQAKQSPRHFKCNAGLDEKAKYLVLGSLVHAGRLEPLALAERYAVMPPFEQDADNCTDAGKPSTSKATRYYKDKVKQFVEANQDKQIVPSEWFAEMKAIVASLCADDRAYRLLSGAGQVEVTLVWVDEISGLLCKARMDRLCRSAMAFVDLKTCVDLESFPRSIARYGYARQMAHYQMGWAVLNGGELLEPWIVAAEKQPPYCVKSAPMCEEALEVGYRERRELLDLIADCYAKDHWPGPESPDKWRLPEWAMAPTEALELIIGGEKLEV